MTDLPIIFSGPMVRAQIAGRKTATRRFAWGPRFVKAIDDEGGYPGWKWGVWSKNQCVWPSTRSLARMDLPPDTDMLVGHMAPSGWQKAKPGDRLWVRENFTCQPWSTPGWVGIDYKADPGSPTLNWLERDDAALWLTRADNARKTIPCIHMPRAFSRLTDIVTATKLERLQEISREDAIAEGCSNPMSGHWTFDSGDSCLGHWSSPQFAFENLWKELHGGSAWDANPEVVALTFTVHKVNIDRMAKETA